MCVELTVTLKGDESKYSRKFLLYPDAGILKMTKDDDLLSGYVEKTMKEFSGNIDDVSTNVKMAW